MIQMGIVFLWNIGIQVNQTMMLVMKIVFICMEHIQMENGMTLIVQQIIGLFAKETFESK